MSKKALIAALALASASLAHAQTIIPRAGITISNLAADRFIGEMENKIQSRSGFVIGAACNLPVGTVGKGIFSVQPEITFIQKGFKVDASGQFFGSESFYTINTHQEYKINYLEFPVLAKLAFGTDKIRFTINAGPSIGFGLGGKFKSTMHVTDGADYDENTKADGKIYFYHSEKLNSAEFDHNVDFGLQGGAGIILLDRLAFDIRYGMSLTNLNHNNESKNRVWQFTVGVPIQFN
jgi:hypothetical protein